MKFPFVKRSRLEDAQGQVEYWRERSKFQLTIPVMTIDGIGEVQIHGDPEQIEKIKARLSGVASNTEEESKPDHS